MKKIFILLLVLLVLVGCSSAPVNKTEYVPVKMYCDQVFETEIYTEVKEEEVFEKMTTQYDLYAPQGGCTAVGKADTLDGLIIGRNMDLYITDKPSFIVKTDVPGFKRTFGLTYTPSRGENADAVLDHGVDREYYDMIPFLQTDVMNEDGFYIEINMRNADYKADGTSRYSCSGTLPNQGKKRIISFLLPYYLGSRCSTVDEAIKIVTEDLDIYTPISENMDWNFGFMLADATGKYGVLEIAENKVVWNEAKQKNKNDMPEGACQANYYVTPEFFDGELMKSGIGRVDYLRKKWGAINCEEDMFRAILGVTYFQSYFDYCQFDSRSEFVGYYEEDGEIFVGKNTPDVVDGEIVVWDYDYVTAPENQKYIEAYIDWTEERATTRRSDGSLDDIGQFWESTFTLIANPQNKTMFIRFNECGKNLLFFKYNEWE